jgi:putative ABC transport system substrate-binding protein
MLLAAGCGGSSSSSGTSKAAHAHYTVCINRYVTFNLLNEVLAGIQSQLPKDGFTPGKNLTYDIQNPQANDATNHTIAQTMVSGNCSILVGFATPGAQVFQGLTKTIPIVFSAASTPVISHLVKSMNHPGGNVTGVADVLPIHQEINAMLQIKPAIKTIGLIYTATDTGGISDAKIARSYIAAKGLKSVNAPMTSAADGTTAAQSLAGRVDAIELPCDSEVVQALPAIMKAADQAKLPVFGCTGDAVAAGAIEAGSYNYTVVGKLTGDLIAKILKGAKPADTPVVVPPFGGYDFNVTQAKKLHLTIPPQLLAHALNKY